MGVSRFLKEKNPDIQIVGLQPSEGASIAGIRRWPKQYLPKIFQVDPSLLAFAIERLARGIEGGWKHIDGLQFHGYPVGLATAMMYSAGRSRGPCDGDWAEGGRGDDESTGQGGGHLCRWATYSLSRCPIITTGTIASEQVICLVSFTSGFIYVRGVTI